VGRGGFGVSKKAPLIDTSGEPVDTIDKFNVSPFDGYGRGRALNPHRAASDAPYGARYGTPPKLPLPIRVLATHIDVRERLVAPNAATE
jgi:hypothetical protein